MTHHVDTLAVRAGRLTSDFKEHSQALFLTSSFTYDTAADAAALFAGEKEGYTYARHGNPTTEAFEARLAALEGAEDCLSTATGMAAIQGLILTFLQAGDHIVASQSLFGSSMNMIQNQLSRLGIQTTFVPIGDETQWQAAITPKTKLFFVETPSNPLTDIADLGVLAQIAHAHDILLVVDNSFCSPVVQRPLALGADLVVYSATKSLDGQGRVMGGAIVGSKALVEACYLYIRTAGAILNPFNAWVLLTGLETLPLRMERASQNALALATWLEAHPAVERVFYPGLPSHPKHDLAMRQQISGGSIVSFTVKGQRAAAWQVVDNLQLFSRTPNLGDIKSTITHPASTTHSRISQAERDRAGVVEGLLRLSIGIEHIDDLIADLSMALA